MYNYERRMYNCERRMYNCERRTYNYERRMYNYERRMYNCEQALLLALSLRLSLLAMSRTKLSCFAISMVKNSPKKFSTMYTPTRTKNIVKISEYCGFLNFFNYSGPPYTKKKVGLQKSDFWSPTFLLDFEKPPLTTHNNRFSNLPFVCHFHFLSFNNEYAWKDSNLQLAP